MEILLDVMVWLCAFSKVLWQTILLWLHSHMPGRRDEIKKMMFAPYRKLGIKGLNEDQQMNSFFTLACVLERTKIMYINDRGNTVHLGGDAYNTSIHKLDGTKARLLDFQKADRPLVVNFGSCT